MARTATAFDRLEASLHRHYGDTALLRGADAVTVVISHNVQLVGDNGEFGQVVSTARFLPGVALATGDVLERLDNDGAVTDAYTLDRPVQGKGNTVEWILLEI